MIDRKAPIPLCKSCDAAIADRFGNDGLCLACRAWDTATKQKMEKTK